MRLERIVRHILMSLASFIFVVSATVDAFSQPTAPGASFETPQTEMKPIGSPSSVDRYRDPSSRTTAARPASYQETGYQPDRSAVRQTVMLQQMDGPPVTAPALPPRSAGQMPPSGFAPPPSGYSVAPPSQSAPPQLPPSNGPSMNASPATSPPMYAGPPMYANPTNAAPMDPRGSASLPPQSTSLTPVPSIMAPSASDYVPLNPPQLQSEYATMNNCGCISAPSSYSVQDCGLGCGTPVSYTVAPYPTATPAAAPMTTAVATPPTMPAATAASAAPVGSLFTLGQEANPVQVGQGLWGQPVAYVPGQGVRNWMRYFFP
ncbi:hypothetical protein [Novipirellula artificiosorum]|uniref:IgA FC receptor n=1 Tax=Novipirellula artificiosorum TaxID=2528016 RepID=A0A5C6DX14_9BACT|nr:hypothetical protein [Novipirellula artificiosorum]TWU41973.1 hypothetical protein Poly41_02690 [Novipirellula artificiosorum]